MCITVTADKKYIHHLYVFLYTLHKHMPGINVLCRVVNISSEEVDNIYRIHPEVDILMDRVGYTHKHKGLKQDASWQWAGLDKVRTCSFTYTELGCYCNNMRFDNINLALKNTDNKFVINMDVDQIIVQPFEIDNILKSCDIMTFNETEPFTSLTGLKKEDIISSEQWIPDGWCNDNYITSHPLIEESFIGIRNTEKTRKMFKEADEQIKNDFMNWDADFEILNNLYSKYNHEISFENTPVELSDRWFFSKNSYIWNGAADGKYVKETYTNLHTSIVNEIKSRFNIQ